MRTKLLSFLMLMAICLLAACGSKSKSEEQPKSDFALGADISWITEMESQGHKFYNLQGEERECTALMKELGLNSVRLRVWVNPHGRHGNWCDKNDLLVKALRAHKLGMDVMVNFHYSDWWADPAKQNIPEAWKGHDYETMKKDVAAHTIEVLQLLKENGVTPKWVQVGNETSGGFLWPMGHLNENPAQYAGLFQAGYNAVKQVFPDAIVMVHLDNGFDEDLYERNLGALQAGGAKWDMVGMSLYPYWAAMYHNKSAEECISGCIANINKVSEKFDCPVMIVETGMQCGDEEGNLASDSLLQVGKEQLARIIRESRDNTNGRCKGVMYWEPQCKPSPYKLGAFTADGKPTAIMEAFTENQ